MEVRVSITPWLLFTLGRIPTAIGCECGWAPRASLDVLEKRKISCLCQDSNPGSSSPKPRHCSDHTVLVSMLGLLDVSSVSFRIMNSCTLCLVPHQLLTRLLLLIFYIFLIVHLRIFLVSDQLDAQFLL